MTAIGGIRSGKPPKQCSTTSKARAWGPLWSARDAYCLHIDCKTFNRPQKHVLRLYPCAILGLNQTYLASQLRNRRREPAGCARARRWGVTFPGAGHLCWTSGLFPDSKLLRFFLDFANGAFVLAVYNVARLVDRRVPLVGILRQQILQFVEQSHEIHPSSVPRTLSSGCRLRHKRRPLPVNLLPCMATPWPQFGHSCRYLV